MNGTLLHASKSILLILLSLFLLSSCGDNDKKVITAPNPIIDTTPDAFSLANLTDQPLQMVITTNEITVEGINSATPISVIGGEYSINGGEFSSQAAMITNLQTVRVRLLSSVNYLTANELTLTIGDISDSFSVTTHGAYTKYANEFSTNTDAKYSIISQPTRGRVITSTDLTRLTFQPMNAFDYLVAGETTQETVNISILGEENNTQSLTFTITGENTPSECENRNIVNITPVEENQTVTHVSDGDCVQLDASQSGEGAWSVWAGENGAARYALFSTLGINRTQANIIFLPETRGSYSFAWCGSSGSCFKNFEFYSDIESSERELDVRLTIPNIHPEDEVFLTVINNDNNVDTSTFSYHWIIHDWHGEYRKLVDIVTNQAHLKFPASIENNNYNIKVIVDDNISQLEGGFTTTSSDLYGKIRLNISTQGNYKTLSDTVVFRPENSIQKPPSLVVMVDGDSTRHQWNEDIPIITINKQLNDLVTFDLSETFDENGDDLTFYINGMLHQNDAKRFSFEVNTDAYYNICVSDGFPWIDEENPCLLFDVIAN